MIRGEEVVGTILAAMERESRVNLHARALDVTFADGIVTLAGEVSGITAKKIALELAAAPSPVSGVVDRLRVEPSEPMEDGAIRDHVCNAFISEPAFASYSIQALVKQTLETVRLLDAKRMLEVEIADGVVILNGTMESISHKRLAGVLAWWVPGSRDVVNGIELSPPMEDNDDELTDAVRLVLEKDPLVNASQIRIRSKDCVVTLDGAVATENSRMAAEADAWYIFGVNNVVNNLMVTG
ncbi:MAG: transporter [Geobacteraceae bacterium GWC2_58_44]|nr:MAG: transporter [Geobacteraceae bacterium GWC2_58_44]HBG06269.1 transporter [Geobacter sp.]